MSLQPAIDIIKQFEGLSLRVYQCPGKKQTIGWGHVIKPHETSFFEINTDQAEKLLIEDIRVAEEAILRFVKVPLTNNQRCALISFVFNLGAGNFSKSTLLTKVNESAHMSVPAEFIRWIFANNIKMRGLIRRRLSEALLYVS